MRPVSGPSPLCRSWTCILQRMPWTVSRIWSQQPWSHLLQAALLTRSCSSCCQPGTVSACHWHCCKRCQSAAWTFGQFRFPWPMQRKEHRRTHVLTLYIIAKMFTAQGRPVFDDRPCVRSPPFPGPAHAPVSSKASPSDCPRGTNGHLLWPKLLAKGFWPHILAELHLFPLQPGECLQELEAGPFLAMACVEAIVSNSDSMKW